MNVLEENVSKIKELFPEAFEEGKIDFDVLKKLLGSFVDKDTERYSFSWNGKSNAIKTALTPTSATLRPDRESSKNWDTTQNIFIEGDNLEVLKVLQDTYRNKIKMIYIDPPYNTGKDFVYSDNFNDTVADYKERTNQAMVSNANTNGRYHTNWLNMMYPRLRLARNLLKDDGVIFISIDDNEITNLRKICDEVFGEDNFIAEIVWRKKYGIQNDAKHFSTSHEYLVCYAKNSNIWTPFLLERSEEQNSRYKNPDNDPRGPWASDNFTAGRVTEKDAYEITTPTGKKHFPPSGSSWRFSKDKYQQLLSENRVYFSSNGDGAPRLKRFLNEVQDGITPTTFWDYDEVGHTDSSKKALNELFNGEAYFDYPKPVELIKRVCSLSTSNDDIILDFFAGSGTTAHAVMSLNVEDRGSRKFVTVQLPEETDKESEACKAGYRYVSDISKERIRRAGEKIKADNKDKEGIDKLDIGFKAFNLDSTNLTLWDEKTQDLQTSLLEQINSTKNGRTQEDVLYEVLLKYGVDLATPITEESINGKKVYSIASGYLLVCLDKDIDLETVSEIAKKKPERVVFYDHGFADDMVKINAEQTLKKAGIEDIRVI